MKLEIGGQCVSVATIVKDVRAQKLPTHRSFKTLSDGRK